MAVVADVRYCVACGGAMVDREIGAATRRACQRCGHVHYPDPKVAVGVAVERDGHLLLVRRGIEPGRGLWALPGGYLDAGEDPRTAAAREAAEEAGVAVEVGAVLDVFVNPADEGGALFVLFYARWISGEPSPGDDADAAAFVPPDAVPDLAFASTRAVVDRWRSP